MSAINGDKARFHRKRKAQIARRARKQELLASTGKASGGAGARKKEATA